MGTLATIISAISADVVSRLSAGGYPALVSGAIDVGTAAEFEQTAPPRIIFDIVGHKYVAPEWYSASAVVHTEERSKQIAQRTISGDNVMITVHCWGSSPTRDIVDDYDVTRALAHAVRAALQYKIPGAYAIESSGKYRPGSNVVRLGRWLTFDLVIFTPVLETLVAYDRDVSFASDTVTPSGADEMLIPTSSATTGPSEAGCT